jgi:hypothetical protein
MKYEVLCVDEYVNKLLRYAYTYPKLPLQPKIHQMYNTGGPFPGTAKHLFCHTFGDVMISHPQAATAVELSTEYSTT